MPCHAAQVRLRTATGLAYTPTDCQLIWQAEGGGTNRPTPKAPAANSALQSVPRPIKRAINEMLHTTTRLWHSSYIELRTDPGERQSRKLGGAGRTLQVAVKRQTFRSPGECLLDEDDPSCSSEASVAHSSLPWHAGVLSILHHEGRGALLVINSVHASEITVLSDSMVMNCLIGEVLGCLTSSNAASAGE